MRLLMLLLGLAVVVALLDACQARACINDRVTVQTETEIKSQYDSGPKLPRQEAAPDSISDRPWWPVAATGTGSALLVLSVGMVAFHFRRVGRS